MKLAKIRVYMRYGGAIFEYEIMEETEEELGVKAREHIAAISQGGYRHNNGKGVLEWFPPHWIDKIKVEGKIPTTYPDRCLGTYPPRKD